MIAPPQPAQLRTAIYCRVSTARQGEDGTSLDTQETRCRQDVAERGDVVDETHVYRETFTGGDLWDRPKLSALRQAIRARDVDAVVCYAIDRLSRDPVHLGVILSEADHAGVAVRFVTEPLDDSPEGQLIRFVRGYAAKVEHLKIAERSIRGKRARVDAGKVHNAGTELYGYRRDKAAGVRVVYDTEARIVVLIVRWYVEDGLSVRAIAARLNRENVPAPSAGKRVFKDESRSPRWGKTVVHRILTDPTYKGEGWAWRRQRNGKTKRVSDRPRDQWVRLPEGTTPAIVEPALWQAAQDRLATNQGAATRNATRPYLLRGVIHCAVCGRKMRSSPEHGGYRVYRCSSRETAAGACGGKRVPAGDVEAWVWAELDAFLGREDTIREEVERRRQAGPDAQMVAERESHRRALTKLTRQEDNLAHRMREASGDNFLWDLVKRDAARIEQERRQLTEAIAAIDARLAEQAAMIEHLESLQAYCATVRANLKGADFATRRYAVEALVERVVANGRDWRLEGTVPALTSVGDVARSSRRCARRPPRSPDRA